MQQIKTLMLREWMQHRRSWLLLGLWTPVIAWALLYLVLFYQGMPQFNSVTISDAAKVASFGISAQSSMVLYIALVGVLLTIPGLPYRDKDDKSLSFWRSLPINEASAVIVPVLMNALLLPLLAIVSALGLNVLLSAPLWVSGLTASMGVNVLLALLGFSLQALLVLLWFLPLVLLLALGNSTIRRWGIVIVLIGAFMVQSLLGSLSHYAPASRFVDIYFSGLFGVMNQVELERFLATDSTLLMQIGNLLRFAINVPFVITLLISGLCLAALILRRKAGQTA
ncbi:hypothetical protein K4H28_13980 [Deefgea tanakiae]|uniref:ABC transporter permease n=1 Tax=Deefgea tanakiae TaxID=2865840 RepID=A0ABX8Z473_9NEIS|nr:hypothetical protein [Deefgea tanakiae]QZA77379.1 hypothetical protein K4H28_13980 [Deefgea tanakiae]